MAENRQDLKRRQMYLSSFSGDHQQYGLQQFGVMLLDFRVGLSDRALPADNPLQAIHGKARHDCDRIVLPEMVLE